MRRLLFLLGALSVAPISPAVADIYEWEYVDPLDPSQGKQQSATLAPDGAGVTVDRNSLTGLQGKNLTKAYLPNANLTDYWFSSTVLDDALLAGADFSRAKGALSAQRADLSGAILRDASLSGAVNLTEADLSGADMTAATIATATLARADLNGAVLVGAWLRNPRLSGASFDNADLTNVLLEGVNIELQSDVSFRSANLNRARFGSSGRWERADFTGANLEDARLSSIGFEDSIFTDAVIRGAELRSVFTKGFTLANLYSTRSYQTGDLTRVDIQYGDFSNGVFAGVDLSGARLRDLVLDGADFSGATLIDATIFGSTLEGADFRGANLTDVDLYFPEVTSVDLRGANLTRASFGASPLVGVDLTDAIVYGASLSGEGGPQDFSAEQLYSTASYKAGMLGAVTIGGDLRGWDFRGQDMTGARFERSSKLEGALWDGATLQDALFFVNELPGSDFSAADVRGVRFSSTNLSGASFEGVDLTRTSFQTSNLSSAKFDNATVPPSATRDDGPGFSGTNLTNASFVGATLRYARFGGSLTGADFTDADVRYVDFSGAQARGFSFAVLQTTRSYQQRDLAGVVLNSWDLAGVDLAGFTLNDASISGAALQNANFSGANLRRAAFVASDLNGVSFAGADLTGVDFAHAEGLTSVDLQDAIIRGANFSDQNYLASGISVAQLMSTRSFQQKDLTGVTLSHMDFSGIDFSHFSLIGFRFTTSDLADANFYDATIRQADLSGATASGFSFSDLQATRSFAARDLRGVNFSYNDLAGWDFSGQSMFGVDLSNSDATGANFDRADLRGAELGTDCCRTRRVILDPDALRLAIQPDGVLESLSLAAGQTLTIRNFLSSSDDPVGVWVPNAEFNPGGVLRFVVDDAPWSSTMTFFTRSAMVNLNGVLRIDVDPGVNAVELVGTSFRLFDWRSIAVGAFEIETPPGQVWDTSTLYYTGVATLVAVNVPEPSALLLALSMLVWSPRRLTPARSSPRSACPCAHHGVREARPGVPRPL